MKDEINQKAIDEIIKYYDADGEENPEENPDDLPDNSDDKTPDDTPELVEIIEEKRNIEPEEEDTKIIPFPIKAKEEPQAAEENIQTDNAETEKTAKAEEIAETTDEKDEENNEDKPEAETDEPDSGEEPSDGDDTGSLESLAALDELGDIMLSRKRQQKEDFSFSKKQIIIIASVTVALMALVFMFVTIDTGFIGSYKHNFAKNAATILSNLGIDVSSDDTQTSGNVKGVSQYDAPLDKSVTIPVEQAGESVFAEYNGGLVFAHANYMRLIDANGGTVWETDTLIVDPIIKAAGHYILLAENGGTKLCLYYDSKMIYSSDTEDSIITCDLSSNGDVLAVTNKASFKGAIVVFNKEGNQIFAWSSGSEKIMSAHISASSRRIAVSLLNTDSRAKSTVQFFDINETESFAQIIFEDTVLFDLQFVGDTVHAFGDNCIAGLNSSGGVLYDKRFENAEFTHYAMDDKGNKILIFDAANIPLINIYGAGETLRQQISAEELPDFADIYGNYIVFNSGRDILYGKAGGKQMAKFTASMDIRNLFLLDKSTAAIVYSNSIELVKM